MANLFDEQIKIIEEEMAAAKKLLTKIVDELNLTGHTNAVGENWIDLVYTGNFGEFHVNMKIVLTEKPFQLWLSCNHSDVFNCNISEPKITLRIKEHIANQFRKYVLTRK